MGETASDRAPLLSRIQWMGPALAGIGDALICTDSGGSIVSMNGVAETLTGWRFENAEERLLAEVLREAESTASLGTESAESAESAALRDTRDLLPRTGTHESQRIVRNALDGVDRRVDVTIAPVPDSNGGTLGYAVIFRETTASDAALRKVAEAASRHSAVLDTAIDSIITSDGTGTILEFNRAAEQTFGLRREEVLGRDMAEVIIPHRLRERYRQGMARHLNTGQASVLNRRIELNALRSDGTEFPVELAITRHAGDGPPMFTSYIRDISERHRIEQALRERETQLQLITDLAPVFLVQWDAEYRYKFANLTYAKRFGLSAEELLGRHVRDVVGEKAFAIIGPHVDEALAGTPVEFEAEIPYLRIGTRIMRHKYAPVRNVAGDVTGLVAVIIDVTDRKRAELAMQESEAQFRQLSNALPQIVWTARPDGVIDYYNERWREFTGRTAGHMEDESWTDLLHPDDKPLVLHNYEESIRAGTLYQCEHRFCDRVAGGYRWFLGRAYSVRDSAGNVLRWCGTFTDIDDTKHAEESTRFLAEASAALAELTDYESTLRRVAGLAVPFFADWCAVDMLQADGTLHRLAVTHSNPAKVELAEELARRYPPQPTDPHGVMNVIRTGESEWARDISDEFLQEAVKDEEQLVLVRELGLRSYICTPLRSRTGVIGALTFVTAESGRTFDEDDLAAAEDLASRAVMAIENANLLGELKDSDRRKDEFLAMLAHELRNPLAPIRNAVQIFRATAPEAPELKWATDVIDRQVYQMSRLVDDLLDVSRITRGRLELRKERVPLATVINNAVEASRPLVERWGHELIVTMPAEPIFLYADATRLAQAFLNLMNNSAKYTGEGGTIWLTADVDATQVRVSVRDTGVGIPDDMLQRIFEMFIQVERSPQHSEGGLGIGLTLVKRLVELHGGLVEARSQGAGLGSEFVVHLPLAAPALAGATTPPSVAVDQDRTTGRILVVDDNRDAADSLGMLLRMLGNEVRLAHDGAEAVKAAATFNPDVVLLDIGLPKMNGYEAAEEIRRMDGGADLLIVALTGWGQEADRRRSKAAGFDHHMTKPVEFTELRKLITRFLVGHKVRSRPA